MASTTTKLCCTQCGISFKVVLPSECDTPADYCPLCGGTELGDYGAEGGVDTDSEDEGD